MRVQGLYLMPVVCCLIGSSSSLISNVTSTFFVRIKRCWLKRERAFQFIRGPQSME